MGKNPNSWLQRDAKAALQDYWERNPNAVALRVSITDNGGTSWLECQYPGERFFSSLKRRVDNPQKDWAVLTELALQMSGLGSVSRAIVRQAVVAATPRLKSTGLLEITPSGFAFKDCIGLRTVTLVEGRFSM